VNKYIKILVGTVVSALGLYLAFYGEDFDGLWLQIQQVNWGPFWTACVLLLVSCIIRAYRWQLLLDPVEKIPLHPLFASTMIGYFGNGVLAFRLGELLRAYSISIDRTISVSQAFGTIILERIMDLLMVVLVFILVIPWFPFEHQWLRFGVYLFSAITFGLIFFIFLAVQYKWINKVKDKESFQSGLRLKIVHGIQRIFDGVTIIRKTKHTFAITVTSFIIWSIYFSITYIILDACNIDLGFIGTGILLVIGSVVIGIPALPGSAGTYDAGVKYGLMVVFSIASEKALTYAIVSHAVSYFPVVLVGAVYFILGSVRIKDVHPEEIMS
jgi:hypothetical protein